MRPEQLERNEARWAALSGAERSALRERWNELRSVVRDGGPEADQLRRRLGTLNRMLQQEGDREVSSEELAARLASLPSRIQTHLGLAPELHWDAAELVSVLRADTRRRMDAFLGNLSHEGLMRDEDLAEFYVASWDAKVDLALELLKREALFFESEQPAEELDELSEMSPLDLAARQEEQRRRRGVIGRAGRLLNLTEDETRRLDSLADEEFEQAFREIVRPAARRLLLEQGVSAAVVEDLVARPYRSLERTMERLLLARR
ncbi:MAG: hypothetical protein DHS20C15_18420 [Planctomycetota bacterium]|nr:MAG: hypothetical protein DHS20C15_18420 [Planctomycetota bacterium]